MCKQRECFPEKSEVTRQPEEEFKKQVKQYDYTINEFFKGLELIFGRKNALKFESV